ncbi:MAG TPA: hypothetical protein VJB14_13490 [Planctomycetota bacterium]|nr:hypothetical protein [Planctomycetota bacterium]
MKAFWNRIPRPLKWAIGIVGIPVALLGIAWIVLYAVASSRLTDALATLRSTGHATSLAELAPPHVPADRNGAPHFLAAFALHPDPEGDDPVLERAVDEGFAALGPKEKDHVRGLLEKSTPLFEKVRAGRARGACRYDLDYSPGLAMDRPDFKGAIRTAKFLRLRAESEVYSGRCAEARETVRDILALADSYRLEPLMICQLVRLAIAILALEVIPPAVKADTSADDLRAWLEIVPRPEALDGAMERAFRGELAGGAQLAGRPVSEALVAVDPSQKNPGWLISTRLLAPYWKIIGANYLVQMAHLVDLSRKPYLEARPKIDAWMAELKSKKTPVFEALSLLLIPALSKAMDRQAVNQTALVVVRTGLAWEIERAAAGRYPEALDVIDPLSGKPLLYDKERGRISSAGLPGKTPEQMENDLLVWTLRAPPGK